ncbi:MAG: biotin--[acetyl-CoA-carboxylase] ligase [Candidatus Rokubacteria bacterium RIFCSPLOWO2_12_FULL_69_21]|nr:MAG: biotin--[acetyl-CoA-carboxylase] ligase [Candidatus Rokubacteria bacterium RIFCSPLOWO2_12_FULL_69_21]
MSPEVSILQDALSIELIRRQLSAKTVARQIYLFGEVPSTNDALRHLAKAGAREGTTVLAESQTAGRGRLGKSWFSPFGVNLYASVLFRPAIGPKDAPVFSFIAGLAVADAVRSVGVPAAIKWPNDILVNRKKVAGVLAELATSGDRLDYLILGVGVNLNVESRALHEALGDAGRAAASLRELAGRDIDRNAFAASFLTFLDEWFHVYRDRHAEALLEAWRDRDILTGRRVEVREDGKVFQGRALGVDAEGHLLVEERKGQARQVVAGQVRLLD